MKRAFDFLRDLKWRVYTRGPQMKDCWGPSRCETLVPAFDLCEGGKGSIDNASQDGREAYPFLGAFSNRRPSRELAWTYGHTWLQGRKACCFMDPGVCRTCTEPEAVLPDAASREDADAGGMEIGAIKTYGRPDALFAKMAGEER